MDRSSMAQHLHPPSIASALTEPKVLSGMGRKGGTSKNILYEHVNTINFCPAHQFMSSNIL